MVPNLGLPSNSYFLVIQILARQVFCVMGSLRGLIVLTIEKVVEVLEGSDAILLPSAEKGIEIALRTDEKRAKLPKQYKVIADFSIETRNSKMY